MSLEFPFQQVIVVGGTGQTGHRLLELLVERGGVRLAATAQGLSGGLPSDKTTVPVILDDARQWGAKVAWRELQLDSGGGLRSQLARLADGFGRGAPTALIFAAAYTNVEGCESDPGKCERINETGTAEVLEWARRELGAKLVFYSTDYVFDGADGPYPETAARHAESRYGQAKVFIEEWLERNAPGSLVLRTTGVYDYLPGSKNFLMQMLELWGQGKTTRIPSDQLSNPVWARDLARATVALLENGASGVFHAGGGAYLARTEFAATIARAFGFDGGLIEPVRTEELKQKAKRPLKGGLRNDKLSRALGWEPGAPAAILQSMQGRHRR